MIKLTGDTHAKFWRIDMFCYENPGTTKENDLMIILGDTGINYHGGLKDIAKKQQLEALPLTFLCIHGNHDRRPGNLLNYKLIDWNGGKVWIEEEFPSIMFAKDGEIYDIAGKKTLVVGGAFSVDKYFRLEHGLNWFEDEEPTEEIKCYVEKQLDKCGWTVDVVLSHTAPIKYEPKERFIPEIDQNLIDKKTEKWLGKIEEKLTYKEWYCGHYHTVKKEGRVNFLFENYVDFPE